ncbi:MAG: hypothetical protein U9O24_07050 [Campylobacterota bacterium]|nr:hypothetical protein [Campylobacterota bacterium]
MSKLSLSMLDDGYAGEYRKSLPIAKYTIDYAKLLINHGADINYKNDEGKTILDHTFKFINTDRIKAKVIYFLINSGAKYEKVYNTTIDDYFKASNDGDMNSLKKIMKKDSYEHIESEINGQCKQDDGQCILKTLKAGYGAVNYNIFYKHNNTKSEKDAILGKRGHTFYILITDSDPKIIALTQTEEGTISLGDK